MNKLLVTLLAVQCLSLSAMTFAASTAARPIYEVPVAESELKPYAQFELVDFKKTIQNNSVVISYTLPLALTGDPIAIVVQGAPGDLNPTKLTGLYGEMKCDKKVCAIEGYQKLSTNPEAATAYLKSLNLKEDEFQKRVQVAKEFSGDPGGIIYLP